MSCQHWYGLSGRNLWPDLSMRGTMQHAGRWIGRQRDKRLGLDSSLGRGRQAGSKEGSRSRQQAASREAGVSFIFVLWMDGVKRK